MGQYSTCNAMKKLIFPLVHCVHVTVVERLDCPSSLNVSVIFTLFTLQESCINRGF